MLIRIPKTFLIDHRERELPTPDIKKETNLYFWIDNKDENLGELINDAQHYAYGGTDASERGLVKAARSLLKWLTVGNNHGNSRPSTDE